GMGELATYRFGVDPPPIGSGPVAQLPQSGRTNGFWYDPALQDPYNHQFHVGAERMLTPTTALTADYSLALQRNYSWTQEVNPFVTGVRVLAPALGAALGDPNLLGSVSIWRDQLPSRYNELAVKLEHRSGWGSLQGSYTLSSAVS